MSDHVKPAPPPRAAFDSQFAREESHVRSRGRADEGPADGRESVAERTSRIDHKMTRATLLLERLAPLDARARLLGSAILRRDEVLIDAVLAQMTDELLELASERSPARRR
jgi:hypothetical protein